MEVPLPCFREDAPAPTVQEVLLCIRSNFVEMLSHTSCACAAPFPTLQSGIDLLIARNKYNWSLFICGFSTHGFNSAQVPDLCWST